MKSDQELSISDTYDYNLFIYNLFIYLSDTYDYNLFISIRELSVSLYKQF